MTIEVFRPDVNEDNPDPRVACVLLLDISLSMAGAPITELNAGLQAFANDIVDDTVARKRTEILVITFGGSVHSDPCFVEARDFVPPQLTAYGGTPMGEAILGAIDALSKQKDAYKKSGIEYFRPWLIVMTDGGPTDPSDVIARALSSIKQQQQHNAFTVFPIGVGSAADMNFLNQLSIERPGVPMKDVQSFKEFFVWLSKSMSRVSVSSSHGVNDQKVAEQAHENGQVPLAPIYGWASV